MGHVARAFVVTCALAGLGGAGACALVAGLGDYHAAADGGSVEEGRQDGGALDGGRSDAAATEGRSPAACCANMGFTFSFCEGFDDGGGLLSPEFGGGGTLQLDDNRSYSRPTSLLTTTPAVPPGAFAYADVPIVIPSPLKQVHYELEAYLDTYDPTAPYGEIGAVQTFDPQVDGSLTNHFYGLGVFGSLLTFSEYTSDNPAGLQDSPIGQLAPGWNHIVLDLSFEADAGGSVSVQGSTTAVTVIMPVATGPYVLYGLSLVDGASKAWAVHIDDVVICAR